VEVVTGVWSRALALRVGFAPTFKGTRGLAIVARSGWGTSTSTSTSRAYVGADVRTVVSLAIDASQLAIAVVLGFSWAIAGGYGTCKEREGDNIQD
jgi:hypothetical protein